MYVGVACRDGADARFAQPRLADRRVRRTGALLRERPSRPAARRPVRRRVRRGGRAVDRRALANQPTRRGTLRVLRAADPLLRRRLLAAEASQAMLPAAGSDARAYRLDWPSGTRLWELDLAPVLAFKEPVIEAVGAEANCERTVLPGDLLDPGWPRRLVAAGFDP
ncbi:class I SAM-dependent methyltransferase [Kitasatospora sp. NPDC018058]|uniref:class I SAM-dependent methyltransferase n=1 Tax=Kitasatospora sp. NPDC018058 TaxID=3364025 RepID=UPI0037BE897C